MFSNAVVRSFVLCALSVGVQSFPDLSSRQLDPAIAAALPSNSSLPQNNASFTCQVLKRALGGGNSTLSPSAGAAYTSILDDNYSATCWLPAQCVVSPENTNEVARVIAILDVLNTTFSLRSGGHKQTPGFAGVGSNGVLVSLQRLNRISLSANESTVDIGPGNRWQNVYSTLEPFNLTVVGGRAGIVGVGGFLLGGGLSYFANQYGLGLDNIESFEVVLGSGRIVTASGSQNADLYKGLRGGATNFGVVTNFKMKTIPIGQFYFEGISYPLSASTQVLNAIASWQAQGQLDPKAAITSNFVLGSGIIETLLLYSTPVPAKPSVFAPFYAINGSTQLVSPRNGTLSDLAALAATNFAPEGIRTYGETFANKVDAAYMVDAYEIFENETAGLPAGAAAVWVPAPVGISTVKAGKAVAGGNLLGLQEVPQQWHEWYITWTDASIDDQIYALSDRITNKVLASARAHGADLPYLFMNTAGTNQKVLQSFGADNVQTIKSAAAKYDPGRVFQRLQNKGYLIRDV